MPFLPVSNQDLVLRLKNINIQNKADWSKALFLHFIQSCNSRAFPFLLCGDKTKMQDLTVGECARIQTFGQDSRLSSLGHF